MPSSLGMWYLENSYCYGYLHRLTEYCYIPFHLLHQSADLDKIADPMPGSRITLRTLHLMIALHRATLPPTRWHSATPRP